MAEIIKLDGTRQLDFDRETVEQAYDRWAPVYDLVFGGVFSKGRRAAIQATNSVGGRVWRSVSAPASRCRNTGPIFASLARIFPRPCCARRRRG